MVKVIDSVCACGRAVEIAVPENNRTICDVIIFKEDLFLLLHRELMY